MQNGWPALVERASAVQQVASWHRRAGKPSGCQRPARRSVAMAGGAVGHLAIDWLEL